VTALTEAAYEPAADGRSVGAQATLESAREARETRDGVAAE